MNYLSLLLVIILSIFLIWNRVKNKSKSSTILSIISFVLTHVYIVFTINILIDSEPRYYGYIALMAILCSPVLIGVGLIAFLRDKKNIWGRVSFISAISAILFSFSIGIVYDFGMN